MTFFDSKLEFLEYIKSYCAKDTIDYYTINLELFEKYLIEKYHSIMMEVQDFTKSDFIGYIAYLRQKDIKNTSIRTYSRAIKVYLRYLFNEGYLLEDVTHNVKYPQADAEMIMPLTAQDVKKITGSMISPRNRIIFHLMIDCGMRSGEVCRLNKDDVDLEKRLIRINNSKNNKSRILPLPDLLKNLITKYMWFRFDDSPALLVFENQSERITGYVIKNMFTRLKKINPNVHAHLLRHTFATSYIMGGGNLETLRILMGHSNYETTRGYIHLANQLELLHYDIYRLDKCMFNFLQAYTGMDSSE